MSRELPILFNIDMVRAILDGRKTVTRRLIKPQPKFKLCYTFAGCNHGTWTYPADTAHEYWGDEYKLPDCITEEDKKITWNPPYHTDDILYARETFFEHKSRYYYKADGKHEALDALIGGEFFKWHPSIHMPKEAARIWLKVTDVRVERLKDITGEQCLVEGVEKEALSEVGEEFAKGIFHGIWDSTIKKSNLARYGWDANPWVWVIEFERCEKPEPCILRGMEPAEDKRPCIGYGTEQSDEPCEMCKGCNQCTGNEDSERCEKPERR